MSLLDIPDSVSSSLFLAAIKPGTVIRFNDPDAGKEKRVVILGMDQDNVLVCYLKINSDVNLNVFRTQEQRDCQYPISAVDNDFLDHDSFVDCTQLSECSVNDIITYMKIRKNAILGKVKQNDLDSMVTITVQAETSVPSQLRRFGLLPPKGK